LILRLLLEHTDPAVPDLEEQSRAARTAGSMSSPLLNCSTYIFENQLSEAGRAADAGSRATEMGLRREIRRGDTSG
jgi:hypothetical protein